MDNLYLKSLNKTLTKKNFFSIFNEIGLFYNNKNKLNIYQLDNLHKDLRKIRYYLATNVCRINLSYNIYYYKQVLKMEKEIIKLCFIKVNQL